MEDTIEEMGIDEDERLYVKPSAAAFPLIYRRAMEVHWDSELRRLFGARPRKWNYPEWFQQIVRAASEQGCRLVVSPRVTWVNVPGEVQKQIVEVQHANNT